MEKITNSAEAPINPLNENKLLREKLELANQEILKNKKTVKRLNGLMKNFFLDTIEIIQNIIEIKAPGTKEHCEQVADCAVYIAHRAHPGKVDEELLRVAAKIHEVGKMAIPESILSKPLHLLSEKEMKLLERHPATAALCFSEVPTFKKIAQIIKHKNEHFDGSGKPDGLSGAAIPKGARILAIADYFDTIFFRTGEYEDPMDALNFIQSKLEKQFDPKYYPFLSQYVHQYYLDFEKPNDRKIALSQLSAGMVISRNLTTVNNVLLLPADTEITEAVLQKLIKHQNIDPIHSGIFIYKRTMEKN